MNQAIQMEHYRPVSEEELTRLIAEPPIDPRGNFLLVRVEDVAETYGESGIVMSTKTVEKEQRGAGMGYVIAIGEGAWSDDVALGMKPWCAVGDKIAFTRYEGVTPPIEGLDGGNFRIIADNKVLGVIP